MTVQEIIDRANARFNSQQNRYGMLTRMDLIDYFATLSPEADRKVELATFLDNFPYITTDQRELIYSDLVTYQ